MSIYEKDYGPFTDYMSQKNSDRCFTLVSLITAADNAAFSDADEMINSPAFGDAFAASRLYKSIGEHINSCSNCKNHPMIRR